MRKLLPLSLIGSFIWSILLNLTTTFHFWVPLVTHRSSNTHLNIPSHVNILITPLGFGILCQTIPLHGHFSPLPDGTLTHYSEPSSSMHILFFHLCFDTLYRAAPTFGCFLYSGRLWITLLGCSPSWLPSSSFFSSVTFSLCFLPT